MKLMQYTCPFGSFVSSSVIPFAAAGGCDGLYEVKEANIRFRSLVDVHARAIENVQLRSDIGNVDGGDLETIVNQMNSISKNWDKF
ncbi:hypothetical protein N7461_004915 [Penicillium sp. DV-2018c]|nr:hypothetical protein N7461_004915 [Penicillium sp. DV-2018c]